MVKKTRCPESCGHEADGNKGIFFNAPVPEGTNDQHHLLFLASFLVIKVELFQDLSHFPLIVPDGMDIYL